MVKIKAKWWCKSKKRATQVLIALFSFPLISFSAFAAESLPVEVKVAKEPIKPTEVTRSTSSAPKKESKEKTARKKITGPLAFIMKNKMAIEVPGEGGNVEEFYLSIDKKVKLSHIKSLSQLQPGDFVEAKVTQTYLAPEKEGQEPFIISNVVTDLAFIRKAEKEAPAKQEGAQ